MENVDVVDALNSLAETISVTSKPTFWDYAPLLVSPLLILISAGIATWGIYQHRKMARTRATLDLIEKVESSAHYKKLHETFKRRRRANTIAALSDPKEPHDFEDRAAVLDYLNHYELVSLGIIREILDDEFYNGWMRTTFVNDWIECAPFIQRERWKQTKDRTGWRYHKALFEHYNCIAHKWAPNEVELLSENTSPPPTEAHGPGDDPKVTPRNLSDDSCD